MFFIEKFIDEFEEQNLSSQFLQKKKISLQEHFER